MARQYSSPRQVGHSIHGGNLVDLPEPHRRLFDDKRCKRKV